MKKCITPPKLEQKSNFGGVFKLAKYDYAFKNKVVKAYQNGEKMLSNTGQSNLISLHIPLYKNESK
ncbi:hypothetical protein CUM84_14235 [Enterococcus faecalis]|jgi:hypothetical protein|nr:hypothetical protein [Enterococcus faecalis]EGO9254463.1 hypothetical protein [Enterococcus faecalis]EIA1524281.1 hypothetical protein [Enterococcus faecalis]PQD70757.1 hypothetical protein CUM84_14235 [Enterococcus faecalis]QCR00688.1 hypothetical protein E7T04_02855 [Enterococcus faecalis]